MLVATNLTRHHVQGGRAVTALAGLSLAIRRGEHVAVTGASGSGKTTLLHVLGLLDPDFGGELLFGGRSARGLSDRARARLRLSEIGIVFQAFHLLPGLTVRDNVALPAWHLHKDRRRARARAEALLDALGLGERAGEDPLRLSGGEMQRVALARALVNDPPVVLADEPTGNLDTRAARTVLEVFARIEAEGRVLVSVSHDPLVVGAAARVVELRDGLLVSDRVVR